MEIVGRRARFEAAAAKSTTYGFMQGAAHRGNCPRDHEQGRRSTRTALANDADTADFDDGYPVRDGRAHAKSRPVFPGRLDRLGGSRDRAVVMLAPGPHTWALAGRAGRNADRNQARATGSAMAIIRSACHVLFMSRPKVNIEEILTGSLLTGRDSSWSITPCCARASMTASECSWRARSLEKAKFWACPQPAGPAVFVLRGDDHEAGVDFPLVATFFSTPASP